MSNEAENDVPAFPSFNTMTAQQAATRDIFHSTLFGDFFCTRPGTSIASCCCMSCFAARLRVNFDAYAPHPEKDTSECVYNLVYVFQFFIPLYWVVPFAVIATCEDFVKKTHTTVGISRSPRQSCNHCCGCCEDALFSSMNDAPCVLPCLCCCHLARVSRELELRGKSLGFCCLVDRNYFGDSKVASSTSSSSSSSRAANFLRTEANWQNAKTLFLVRRNGSASLSRMKKAVELWNVLVITFTFLPLDIEAIEAQKCLAQAFNAGVLSPEHIRRTCVVME